MSNTTETKKVTMKELAQAFEGKYVNVSSVDHYGIAIEMTRGTIEYEDNLKPELWFVSRDSENNVTGSVTIDEDIIECIEESDDTYTISFSVSTADIDISEYKSLEQLQTEHGKRQ
ncbi:hypothetical protein NSB25_26625 [Acetatifactor muris]|uniref:Uncharacterized protein n=1 Tax=Acetatifactor muris TaxID=879566 RepID=A0A2K4ZPA8_9FIRM|nr:hypothetical protein [Acetatifactor muris]MCR2050809.1 hypothetical protein [Acetatifactor muris]SOY32323.1 hypothetical protein AMURIS_05081 [Acetatifactor muris]